MADRPVLVLHLGDVIRLRRPHPCGSDLWTVDRLGADIGLRCRGCGRHVMLERSRIEQRLVTFVERGAPVEGAPVGSTAPDRVGDR